MLEMHKTVAIAFGIKWAYCILMSVLNAFCNTSNVFFSVAGTAESTKVSAIAFSNKFDFL